MANYLAILVASVVSYIIGALWYSPLLFGKMWCKLMNFTEKDMEKAKAKGMAKNYITMFISVVVMAYVLSQFVVVGQGWMLGAKVGTLIWFGFLATSMLSKVLWEGKPFALYAINTLHYLVVLVIMGSILGAWG